MIKASNLKFNLTHHHSRILSQDGRFAKEAALAGVSNKPSPIFTLILVRTSFCVRISDFKSKILSHNLHAQFSLE